MKRLAILLATGLLALVAACGTGAESPALGAQSPPRDVQSPPRAVRLKVPEAGFELPHRNRAFPGVDTLFVEPLWRDLEPTKGSFTGPGWTEIKQALAQKPAALKIRPVAGIWSPDWVEKRFGPCIHVGVDSSDGSQWGCVPQFWKYDGYWTQYRQLLDEIQRRYGNNPRVTDVTACGAMTVHCEPFIRTDSPFARAELYNAGLTEAVDRRQILRSVEEVADAMPRMRVSIATHFQWQIMTADGSYKASWPDERAVLQTLRAKYGNDRLVIQNNGIGGETSTWNGNPADAPDMMAYFRNDPGRHGFQGGYKGVDGSVVLDHAVNDLHAEFFENITNTLSRAEIRTYGREMKANAGSLR